MTRIRIQYYKQQGAYLAFLAEHQNQLVRACLLGPWADQSIGIERIFSIDWQYMVSLNYLTKICKWPILFLQIHFPARMGHVPFVEFYSMIMIAYGIDQILNSITYLHNQIVLTFQEVKSILLADIRQGGVLPCTSFILFRELTHE